ncbi:hypothetical protein [Chamaesiphon sp. VAR_48_metabat_135_sub]|uniref:hypothetical protein n=1 Tax=Chamaesiphon sp. VAR_48_metabat_135_sub TaxID=2964699 RepID=UPI00286C39D0|nr:hypothetical protein [Chamaesiphon sp. VAR_48_metabat_135_sub]
MSILPPAVIQAIQEAELIQKHDRLCDLAAIDAIPIELVPLLTLNNQISIAKQPTTAQRILVDFATSEHKEVRLAILKNSNITATPLIILSEDKDINVRRRVQFHPQTPGEILLKFRRYFRYGTYQHGATMEEYAACRNLTNPELLRELSQHENSTICSAVARNPATPIDILRKPAFYTYYASSVAANPSTPVDILEEQIRIGFGAAISSMYRNPLAPSHLLTKIASGCSYDRYDYIPGYIARHPNTPLLTTISILKRTSILSGDVLRSIYINSLQVSELEINLAIEVQSLIANHPNLPGNIREELIKVDRTAPIDMLEKFSHSKDRTLTKLAQSRLRSIYRELAANPETPTEQLWEMLYHRDIEIRLAVLLHPQGLNLLLDRALQLENSLNRFIAGLHPQLSTVQRDKLLYSDNWLDRLAIACNPSVSIEHLNRLSRDFNPVVRDIASQLKTE